MSNDKSELKPCPFCGESPEIVMQDAPNSIVACENRACEIKPSLGGGRFKNFKEVAFHWNTRANQPSKVVDVKHLLGNWKKEWEVGRDNPAWSEEDRLKFAAFAEWLSQAGYLQREPEIDRIMVLLSKARDRLQIAYIKEDTPSSLRKHKEVMDHIGQAIKAYQKMQGGG